MLFAQESKLSVPVYYLWLIVICLFNRVILDDRIPEFCNFEVGEFATFSSLEGFASCQMSLDSEEYYISNT